ncbi:MAG: GYD domain-containing protein [Pirellulales bacterium]|nr:GYD domain-containing protein [Pirellulales bacterium]
MATFLMVGTYLPEGIAKISAARTKQAVSIIKEHKGKLESGYVTLGKKDITLVVDFPDVKQAMKASIALSKKLAIAFATSPAVTVQEFDAMMGKG